MKKHRMAIIGCGAISQSTHLPNAQKNPRVELVCIYDINQSVAEQAGEKPRWLDVNKGHYAHMDRFIDYLEGHGPNPNNVESAVPVNLIALKLLESVRLGLPVIIGLEDWQIPE